MDNILAIVEKKPFPIPMEGKRPKSQLSKKEKN